MAAVTQGAALPENACWLTFDDGFKDHHRHVLPELLKRNIQGSFFPAVKPIMERSILDVHQVHFILASAGDFGALITDLHYECKQNGLNDDEVAHLWNTHAVVSKYDSKEVAYFKRMLQFVLPEHLRNSITSRLFEKYVKTPQLDFAADLYMSEDEVKDLVGAGMYVGSHGYKHLWFDKENKKSQDEEIQQSLHFLKSIGAVVKNWIMCYPYGAHNDQTLDLLTEAECAIGLTTQFGQADFRVHHPLKLPRFDTNDFPQ
ncbi:MAG: polysaccharide deacetylase family protein [Actinomycetota bacterium]|nr:polysaccharide deacetylase family protein [Actinomycetota bacterium]